jgi:hypothetical protein
MRPDGVCVLDQWSPQPTQHNTFPFPQYLFLSSNIYTMVLLGNLIFLTKMVPTNLMKHPFLFFYLTSLSLIPVSSLNIGVQTTGITISVVFNFIYLSTFSFQTLYLTYILKKKRCLFLLFSFCLITSFAEQRVQQRM